MAQCPFVVKDAAQPTRHTGALLDAFLNCQRDGHPTDADGQAGHELPPNSNGVGQWIRVRWEPNANLAGVQEGKVLSSGGNPKEAKGRVTPICGCGGVGALWVAIRDSDKAEGRCLVCKAVCIKDEQVL